MVIGPVRLYQMKNEESDFTRANSILCNLYVIFASQARRVCSSPYNDFFI